MRPDDVYLDQALQGASPVELVVALYDGFSRFARSADEALRRQDVEAADEALSRAEAVVDHLRRALDPAGGELATNLESLYEYVLASLGDARRTRDASVLGPSLRVFADLRTAWAVVASEERPRPPRRRSERTA